MLHSGGGSSTYFYVQTYLSSIRSLKIVDYLEGVDR